MKAVVFTEFGSADKLQLTELPIPSPGEDEVLVKVLATTIDNVDIIIRKGIYKTPLQQPAITGRDLVGLVEKVGSQVQGFSTGMKVWTNSAGFGGRMGASAEYVLVKANRLYEAPPEVNPDQLVAALHAGSTAQMLTRNVMKLIPGSTFLVEGAAGNVGRKLVQCANELGAFVITTSSKRDFDLLKQLGANNCFSYDEQGMQELAKYCKEQPPEHIIDTSGKVSLQTNLALLATHGQLTLITTPAGEASFDAPHFYMQCQSIQGFVISAASVQDLQENADYLNQYFAKGLLLEDPISIHSLEELPDLQAQMENYGAHGVKYVIHP